MGGAQRLTERNRKYAPKGSAGRIPKGHVFIRGMLRCGSCGTSREVLASNAAVAEYDGQLDHGMRDINAAAEQLAREALAAEADTLGAALRRDLLTADDFR